MTKETIRKNSISEIKLMMMGRDYLYLSEPLELEDETIRALTWMGGEPAYVDDRGCLVGVGILCTDELVSLRKGLYQTISAL